MCCSRRRGYSTLRCRGRAIRMARTLRADTPVSRFNVTRHNSERDIAKEEEKIVGEAYGARDPAVI